MMTSRTTITVRIIGHNLPGLRFGDYDQVHVGVQREAREQVLDPVPGDASAAVFTFPIDLVTDNGQADFRGPFVQGKRGERFIYLSWGELLPDGQFRMFRRAKLLLAPVTQLGIAEQREPDTIIEATVNLTGKRGGPVCALLRPPDISWQLVREP
jgi:hypothetical protein